VSYDTLHWDGNALLFTTNAQGQVDDIKVGDVADITPSGGLIFYDRGFGNEVSFCHSSSGYGGNGSNSYTRNGGRQGQLPVNPCGLLTGAPATALWAGPMVGAINGGVGQGDIVTMPRSDGLSDGYNTIQGTRSYDSVVGNWSAPDAYSGDVHDPATQKSYMWNGNNPVSYSDPSGYYSQYLFSQPGYESSDSGPSWQNGGATPDPMPTVSSGLAVYTALVALAIQAAATAVDKAIAESRGPFSGDRDSFLENLQAMVQSGLDWFGIRASANLNLATATVSVAAGSDRMSLTGNANGLQLSASYDNAIHQNAIVIGTRTGAMISWERKGSYAAPQNVTLGIHIHLQIKGVPMFDPYLSYGFRD
jgi:hypothetical protein